jgi:signal transduction histidine kinase
VTQSSKPIVTAPPTPIEAEAAQLRMNERSLSLAVGLTRTAVFRVGTDLRYQWSLNQVGGGRELAGKANADLFDPEGAAIMDALFGEAVALAAPLNAVLPLTCMETGQRYMLEVALDPIRDEFGQICALAGAATDLTTEVERHRAMRAAQQRADIANALKTHYLSTTSHDLRQPLQAMRLMSAIIANRFSALGDERGLKAVECIAAALATADEMVGSLLDIGMLESGRVVANVSDFPLVEAVAGSVAEFAGTAEMKGLKLRTVPCRHIVRSDPVLVRRILRNLVVNALKYTDTGGVLVGSRRRGQGVWVEVWDTGRGVPADKLSVIFEEFERGIEEANRDDGYGLGLSIVARLSALLGHRVTVRSTLGKGSMFGILVPLAPRAT